MAGPRAAFGWKFHAGRGGLGVSPRRRSSARMVAQRGSFSSSSRQEFRTWESSISLIFTVAPPQDFQYMSPGRA